VLRRRHVHLERREAGPQAGNRGSGSTSETASGTRRTVPERGQSARCLVARARVARRHALAIAANFSGTSARFFWTGTGSLSQCLRSLSIVPRRDTGMSRQQVIEGAAERIMSSGHRRTTSC